MKNNVTVAADPVASQKVVGGTILVDNSNRFYMFAQVSGGVGKLICLSSGNRVSDDSIIAPTCARLSPTINKINYQWPGKGYRIVTEPVTITPK